MHLFYSHAIGHRITIKHKRDWEMLWLCDHEEARTMDLTKNKQLAVTATVCPSGHHSHVPPFFPNIKRIQKNSKNRQSTLYI